MTKVRTRFGPYTLNSDTRQLLRGSQEIHLSPKAFELLSTLLARRPAVLTKEELFRLIWPGTFVSEANLNVLVGEVRRALDDEPRAPRFIRTAHGVGYAFCGEATDLDAARDPAPPAPPARYWLEGKDRTYPLEAGERTVGRDPACDIWLNDPSVSRRHARIAVPEGPGPATLNDLASTNGTFIGRRQIDAPTALADGARVTFGSVELTFCEGADRLAPTRRVRRNPRS